MFCAITANYSAGGTLSPRSKFSLSSVWGRRLAACHAHPSGSTKAPCEGSFTLPLGLETQRHVMRKKKTINHYTLYFVGAHFVASPLESAPFGSASGGCLEPHRNKKA